MHEHRQFANVVLRNVVLSNGGGKNMREHHLQLVHVLAELRVGLGGEHGAHRRARRQVAARQVVDLQANVDRELVNRVFDALQADAQLVEEAFGLVQGVGDQQFAHVGEVVVDCGAADAGVLGDVGHGQAGEAAVVEDLAEGVEDGALGVFALGGVGCCRNTRHSDTLP